MDVRTDARNRGWERGIDRQGRGPQLLDAIGRRPDSPDCRLAVGIDVAEWPRANDRTGFASSTVGVAISEPTPPRESR